MEPELVVETEVDGHFDVDSDGILVSTELRIALESIFSLDDRSILVDIAIGTFLNTTCSANAENLLCGIILHRTGVDAAGQVFTRHLRTMEQVYACGMKHAVGIGVGIGNTASTAR